MKIMKLIMAALLLITAGLAVECMAESAPDAVNVAESMADAVSMAESTVNTVSMNENGIYTVTFDDKEMDYFRFGNENGPKVVILPGVSLKSLMGAKDAVTNAYSLLAKDYDVYLFDRIRVFPEDYDVYAMADDTLRAIRAAGLHDVRIMGVSQGSMMAMVMAVRDPELVHSIMLCSSAARIADSAVFETWQELAEERNTPALMEAFGEYVYTPSFFEKYKDQIIASGEGASEQEYENFIISVGAAASFDWYDHLKEITCPALVIGASEDRVLGVEASYELIEQLECESFIYEGYGHGVYDEAPDFLTHIKAFLDEYKDHETVSNSDSGADESTRTVPGTHSGADESVRTVPDAHRVGGRQGICTEGGNYWVSGSGTLEKYDSSWNLIAENKDPFDGYSLEVNHIGDIDVYNNELYLGVEYFMDGEGKNIQVAVYDGDTLKLKRIFPFRADTGQLECSGIAVDPDSRTVYMCSWVDDESSEYLYMYDLDTGDFKGKLKMQPNAPKWLQGVAYFDGSLYVTSDDGDADKDEPDHMYRIDVSEDGKTGQVSLAKTFDDVIRQGEIEGLTFDNERGQLLVLYNRGARIIAGMPRGFYEGYSEEIHEVFVYPIY